MKTEQEIVEELKKYEKIKENCAVFTTESAISTGVIRALKWVLDNKS